MVVEAWLAEERQQEARQRRALRPRRTWCQCLGRCCCFCFLLNLVLTGAAIAALYVGLRHVVQDYSVTQAAELTEYSLPPPRVAAFQGRVRETWETLLQIEHDGEPLARHNLVVTQDEINGWVGAQLGGLSEGHVYVQLKEEQLEVELRIPIDHLPGGVGRYFAASLLFQVEPCKDESHTCGFRFLDEATAQVTLQLVPQDQVPSLDHRTILYVRSLWSLARDRTRRTYWSFVQVFNLVDDAVEDLHDPDYWKFDLQQNGLWACRISTDECELMEVFLYHWEAGSRKADILQALDRVTGLSIHDGFLVVHVEGGGSNIENDNSQNDEEEEEAVPTSNYVVHRARPGKPPRRPVMVRPRRSLLEPAKDHGQEL